MCKLSIVMASSNSNYGGEVYREVEPAVPTPEEDRVRLSMHTLHESFKNVDYEVVFVEWNRLPHRKPYREYDFMKHDKVRVIEVPKEFSDSVIGPENQFHEMWAKNVGIRRSEGDLILGTNLDVLWLYDMDRVLSRYTPTPMVAWRWTVFHNVLELGMDMDKIKEYCFDNSNRIDHDRNSNGDFTLMTADQWWYLQGYSITFPGWAGCDMWQVRRGAELAGNLVELPWPVFHIRHPGRPLESGYGTTNIIPEWGAPSEKFEEWVNSEKIR